jgi:cardiolipin synthase A/B
MTSNELWSVIAELGFELHPDRINAVADKIEGLGAIEQFTIVRPLFGPSFDKSIIDRFDHAWQNATHLQPAQIASALRGASFTASLHESKGSIEMVWSGPPTGLVPIRHSEQVLCEVIDAATQNLFIVSYVVYEVEAISRALTNAARRNVKIDVLLERSIEDGGKVTVNSIKKIQKTIPSANVYIWDGKKGVDIPGSYSGSVHAKCAVADNSIAFITSANLSPAAMERNMELGVLIKGGHLPDELHQHLSALVTTKKIEAVSN